MSKELLLFRPEVIRACEESFPDKTLDIFNQNDFNIDPANLMLLDEIGKGAYGHVRSGVYNGRPVAVKIQPIPEQIQQCTNILIELSTMQSLPHDKLVRYIGSLYRLVHNGPAEVLIVMELCEKGSLRSCLKREIPWNLRVRLALDAAWGILFLHENNIIHRDIKTGNVLVDRRWRAKVCDMAFACHRSSTRRMTFSCGTEDFMAPEISLAYDCDLPSDVFSFGIMLCEIMTGKEPSRDFLHRKAQNKFEIKEEEIRNSLLPDCPVGLEALAYQCCDGEPSKRPTILQCIEELESILLDLGGEDIAFENSDADDSHHVSSRTIEASDDDDDENDDGENSIDEDVSDVNAKLGEMEAELDELKAENLRLAAELAAIKIASSNTSANTKLTIDTPADASTKGVPLSPTYGLILQNLSELENRISRIEVVNSVVPSPKLHCPTTLENPEILEPIPADLWGQMSTAMNTLMGFNQRLESIEGQINTSNGVDGNSTDATAWQTVAEFLKATVKAQQKLQNSDGKEGQSANDEHLTKAVDNMSVDADNDPAKQLLVSLGSFLSSVGLYNGSDVLNNVDRALNGRRGDTKRGHSIITDTPHSGSKSSVRTPKISRVKSGNTMGSVQEGSKNSTPVKVQRTISSRSSSPSVRNRPSISSGSAKIKGAPSISRSDSRSESITDRSAQAFFNVDVATQRFLSSEPILHENNRPSSMGKIMQQSVPRTNSITSSTSLRSSLSKAEDARSRDLSNLAFQVYSNNGDSGGEGKKKGIVSLKDIVVEHSVRLDQKTVGSRAESPSSTYAMSGQAPKRNFRLY